MGAFNSQLAENYLSHATTSSSDFVLLKHILYCLNIFLSCHLLRKKSQSQVATHQHVNPTIVDLTKDYS
jgi:hypothetical protein